MYATLLWTSYVTLLNMETTSSLAILIHGVILLPDAINVLKFQTLNYHCNLIKCLLSELEFTKK